MTAPELRFNTISFLSDYGHADEFVGVVHSVIRSIVPDVRVIDITHEVAPHDVRAGGLALARSAPYMAPGIALAVVDPGVGTDRKGVIVEVADGGAYLVGPDNGLLAPAVALIGGATGAVILDNPDYQLDPVGQTFDGRDVFAPAAAHLCLGVPFTELGTSVDPIQLLPGLLPVSEVQDDGSITCEVLWVDRFGNAQLNLEPEYLDDWPDVVTIAGGRINRNAARVSTFGEIIGGGFGLLVDSYGLLSIAVDRGSAAAELELTEGDEITLWPSDRPATVSSPVTIQAKPMVTRPEDAQVEETDSAQSSGSPETPAG
ncbi:MAG: SAM hydrolase/SAM-dependent halogenase family protein [Acidimicrobiales bacterium]